MRRERILEERKYRKRVKIIIKRRENNMKACEREKGEWKKRRKAKDKKRKKEN
jgi:hypothetical protein